MGFAALRAMKISLRTPSPAVLQNLSHILLASARRPRRIHARSTHGALRDCSLRDGNGAGGAGRDIRERKRESARHAFSRYECADGYIALFLSDSVA